MATFIREPIGQLTDKVTVQLAKDDYLSSFETSLKKYAKTANIPGFRKGMVPASLIKKMYGNGLFTDEVLKTVEKELNNYMAKEQLDIFAQPLPLDSDARMLDMNNPGDYAFAFEIGLKPSFEINATDIQVVRYVVTVTEDMINNEISHLQTRNGKMTEPELVNSDENILNVYLIETDENGIEVDAGISKNHSFPVQYFKEEVRKELMDKKKDDLIIFQLSKAFNDKERERVLNDLGLNKNNSSDADKFFKMTITKIGIVEKADLNEEFYESVYPDRGIKTEAEFRNSVKAEIENYYRRESNNQMHDQMYHYLLDNTKMEFPEAFLKRWLKDGSENPKTTDEAALEYPGFVNQLKWNLISTKLINDNNITVEPNEIKDFARHQIIGYMNAGNIEDMPWLDEYANRMLKDQKFVEETYMKIQTSKLFSMLENQVQATEENISAEDFAGKLHHHH